MMKMLIFVFGISLVITGLSAQTCTLTCSNGGTCRTDASGMMYCDCTTNWTGPFCDISASLIPFIWTADENCQMSYGKEFSYMVMPGMTSVVCSSLSCNVPSYSTFSLLGQTVATNGTMCDANSVCYMGECIRFKKAPQPVILDQMIGNQTCFNYLSNGNSSYARTFCKDQFSSFRCSISCQKFLKFDDSCTDTFPACRSLSKYCNSIFPGTNSTVKSICPFACNNCPDTPLKCSTSYNICMNGGICQNTTVVAGAKFAYKCLCPTGYSGDVCEIQNPCANVSCPTGKTCKRLGTYAAICA